MAYFILLIFLIIQTATAPNPCCTSEDNRLVKRKCADGSPITLTCPQRYFTQKEAEMDNTLTSKISSDRYCTSKMNDTDVMVVCFDDPPDQNSIFKVYASFELVSVFFILITIFVYLQVGDLLDLQNVCILHSISGLGVSFLTLAIRQLLSQYVNIKKNMCILLAYVIYFTMLYSFFWMNVLAFHIWRTIVKPKIFKMRKYWSYIYHAFGCGGPIFLLIVLIIANSMRTSDIHPGFGESSCWFKSMKTLFVYLYGPIAVLLCFNVLYYGWTIEVLWQRVSQQTDKRGTTKVLKYRFLLCLKLFFLMGISWIFDVLSAAFEAVGLSMWFIWYVTDGLNTLQGILIFLILVVFRKRIIRGLANRSVCGIRLPGRWRTVADDECEEIEEELNLSETTNQQNI